MAYDILMPQLSDSMDEGKLIGWKVKEGDSVKKGDVIAEVESDKAIMQVQSFKDGVVKHIAVKEGDNVPVGTLIASIDTDVKDASKATPEAEKTPEPTPKPEKMPAKVSIRPTEPVEEKATYHDSVSIEKVAGNASPKAKHLAFQYKLDVEALQKENKLPTPAHEEDIKAYYQMRFFTPKALQLLQEYHLDASLFLENKKHNTEDILAYIQAHDIPLPKRLSPFQKALITSVEASAKKPTYRLYDSIDATLLASHKTHTMTVWLIKIFAEAMMRHEVFRSRLSHDAIIVSPNASISLAVSYHDSLYMPVFKHANLSTPSEIQTQLQHYEARVKEGTMTQEEMAGSSFGLSNLGMFGISRFDAMINKDDSGIAAIGAIKQGEISITLTLDHRLINGNQAAAFMQTLKELAKDAQFFKDD